jgi:hypothetical protein
MTMNFLDVIELTVKRKLSRELKKAEKKFMIQFHRSPSFTCVFLHKRGVYTQYLCRVLLLNSVYLIKYKNSCYSCRLIERYLKCQLDHFQVIGSYNNRISRESILVKVHLGIQFPIQVFPLTIMHIFSCHSVFFDSRH